MAHVRRSGRRGRIPLVLLVVIVVVGGMPLSAQAALVFDNHLNTGNGRNNRNSVTINSPEFNRGIQHITNTNTDGVNDTQASFCKRWFRHCRISQRQKAYRSSR